LWSRNAAADTNKIGLGDRKLPLVVDLVVVAVSGTLAAYDLATGKPRWVGPQRGGSGFAAAGDDRRRRPDPAAQRTRRGQRRAG
jgi:hypothetical protein